MIEAVLGDERVQRLQHLDWDFKDTKTGFLTHSVHPYPAKFIPQIPKTIINELATPGQVVLDPFCGSGTTLLEAMTAGCNAIGIDANPLACLISRAKTYRLNKAGRQYLDSFAEEIANQAHGVLSPAFDSHIRETRDSISLFKGVEDWFDEQVILELAYLKLRCSEIEDTVCQEISLAAFSSIIVAVSKQDSDTRYVRRDKNVSPGDCFKLFSRSLKDFVARSTALNDTLPQNVAVEIYEQSVLTPPNLKNVDLMVCSPPYPNAYSYHLYHRTRMLWLGMDQPKFKKEEIGSHRKYSSKSANKATIVTFTDELSTILTWLSGAIKPSGYACFIIGDSTLGGINYKNDEIVIREAGKVGFVLEANINRNLQLNKKSFNPKIGKIRDEHIVILRNQS